MPSALTWDNLSEALLAEFPELRHPRYTEIVGGIEGWTPGHYVIFGSLFTAYLEDTASAPATERCRIGAFIEKMAESTSGGVEILLRIEVWPTLLRTQTRLNVYWPFLGQKTRALLARAAVRQAPQIVFPDDEREAKA